MGTIIFEGQAPFELMPQRQPESTVEGENVVLTLPVFVPGLPQHEVQIRVVLNPDQAEYISAQLKPCSVAARARARLGR